MYYGYNLAKTVKEPAISVAMIYLINFGATYSEMKDIYDYQNPHKPKKPKASKGRHLEKGEEEPEESSEIYDPELLDLSVNGFRRNSY